MSSGFLAVDVARKVEVVFVLLDLCERRPCAQYFGNLQLLGEGIDDLVDVLRAQAVLGAVFHEACAGIDHEDALAGLSVLLVEDDDAGGDAGAVKQVGGQTDDALDVALADKSAADVRLGIAAEQHAMRQNARSFAGALERADDVQQVGVVALLAGRHAEGLETLVSVVERIESGAPPLIAERRIGDDVVKVLSVSPSLNLGSASVLPCTIERRRVVVQDHVHAGQAAGGGVFLLAVERDRRAGLVGDLQEQRTRAAGRVIDGRGGVVLASRMPMICAMMRLTSAGV